MATVFLALGSNVGDSEKFIGQAIDLLAESVSNIFKAPLYQSKASGVTNQPIFLNTAVRGETTLSPTDLLKFVKSIEKTVGRIQRYRWGPREIDIDIIFYDDLVMKTDRLTIPHLLFAEREFVLQPVCDIDPDYIDPRSGLTIKTLLKKIPDDQRLII